jgi:hypothetical protein
MREVLTGGKEDKMVVLVTQEFLGVSREDTEEGSRRLNASEDPPAGLIAHVLTEIPGGMRAVDIWESEADFQTFAEERLMPTAKALAQERGISMEGVGPPTFTEAYDLFVGLQA